MHGVVAEILTCLRVARPPSAASSERTSERAAAAPGSRP
jgi:hypothetical protein